LPLFLRHDPWAKHGDNQFKPVTTAIGWNIVAARPKADLDPSTAGTTTRHSFRHYFVTIVFRASRNLSPAQALALLGNIITTSDHAAHANPN
jgi:hypothetical protein